MWAFASFWHSVEIMGVVLGVVIMCLIASISCFLQACSFNIYTYAGDSNPPPFHQVLFCPKKSFWVYYGSEKPLFVKFGDMALHWHQCFCSHTPKVLVHEFFFLGVHTTSRKLQVKDFGVLI